MEFRSTTLADAHDLSHAVPGWEQAYRQITPGRFEGTLFQANGPGFQFYCEATNRRVAQTGVSPTGLWSIGVPLYAPMHGTFQGQAVDGYAIMALGEREEFQLYTPESMHYVVVSLPAGIMEELVGITAGDAAVRQLRKHVLPVSGESVAVLRAGLARYFEAGESNPAGLVEPSVTQFFQDEVVSLMLGLLDSAADATRDFTHSTYSDIVRRCERLVHDQADRPLTVLDLCRRLRCCRRTLQTSFHRVANVTPVEYLRSIRLNAVRQLLRSTASAELLIGDAAARWGFTHLSYFAREYRELFGELPSQTPRKC
ncbi:MULTISPECIES: helix-turn-helix domain-containing protein [Paraburkholderia]|uniref:helix-turn-helix domain-containing protein n=1 Tax=Paraburkholderia TaxID=1822464 RepID=UPI00038006FF|nr:MULTISPECIES: helix-turn-helix domain-containing protein [Paraburkholderia]MDH6148188.1 AraC family ethanolamine operon transcriptional activator [Paraburkholderia sp. WSM4179]